MGGYVGTTLEFSFSKRRVLLQVCRHVVPAIEIRLIFCKLDSTFKPGELEGQTNLAQSTGC